MTKPTLLQTILNRPSQSYINKIPQEKPSRQDMLRIAAERVQSSVPAQAEQGSVSTGRYFAPGKDCNVEAVNPAPSTAVYVQGSSPNHVPPSHASPHSASTSTSTASTATRTASSSPPPPPKDLARGLTPRPKRSRNINLESDSASSRQRADTTPSNPVLGAPSPNNFFAEDSDDDDESGLDVFYTPNSSPRTSLASFVSTSMSYVATAPPTLRKVSRRSLRGNGAAVDRVPSYRTANSNPGPKDDNKTPKSTQPSPSSAKTIPINNPQLTTASGPSSANTSPEPSSSRPSVVTQVSPSPSTRIAVPSTRTPSRSHSLNRSRPTIETRSGPSSPGGTGSIGQGNHGKSQAQGRAITTASMFSNTSSMSSNSLEGHSVVFSDLVTETRATTPQIHDGNGAVVPPAVPAWNTPKKAYGSAPNDATKRWVDKVDTANSAKATTTPLNQRHNFPSATPSGSSTQISQPRKRPVKAHTYNGLGITSTSNNIPSSSPSTSASPTLYNQYQYSQYQHNRGNKGPGVMMSMTAVLEAAEEEELYKHEKEKGGVGSPAWKARQLLRQHRKSGKSTLVEVIPGAQKNSPSADPKGKGKEKAGTYVGGESIRSVANGGFLDKGKGKERDFTLSPQYTKHQPVTSSPLAMPSTPLPTPSSSPPPRNNSSLEIPKMFSRPRLTHRRSRSLGPESMPRYQRSESPSPYRSPANPGTSASHLQQDIITSLRTGGGSGGHSRAFSLNHSHGSTNALSTTTGTGGAVDLSALPQSSGQLPSKGTSGYSSLVLPRAPLPLNLHGDTTTRNNGIGGSGSLLTRAGGGDGRVDLTKDGLAQTTMASVEVVRGLGGTAGKKGLMGMLPLVRRKTILAKFGNGMGLANGEMKIEEGDEVVGGTGVMNGGMSSSLGFTSHRKPPEYVPSGSVLVQVWAVGVDGVDGRLTGVRMVHGNGNGLDPTVPPSPVAMTSNGDQDNSGNPNGGAREQDEGEGQSQDPEGKPKSKGAGLGRSLSLRERLSRSVSLGRSAGKERQTRRDHSPDKLQPRIPTRAATLPHFLDKQEKYVPSASTTTIPGIGYIPGRSFVGRVVECGWEVRDDVARKGDWVAGLLDIKKCGALTEFIVVDRHRIHRVPHPKLSPGTERAISALVFSSTPSSPSTSTLAQHNLTLEELALLPLCGVPAYRAVRTFMYAFSSMRDNPSISSVGRTNEMAKHRPAGHDPNTPLNFATYGTMVSRYNLGDHENGRRRRALVLRGHDGTGAIAVQMLVLRGWRVCVHVPFIASPPNVPTTSAIADGFMEEVEERIREWGAEEVIFDDGEIVGMDEGRGAVVRVVDGLREDGDVFDAVLDTLGGKEVREAAERLLRSPGRKTNPDESLNGGSRNNKSTARGTGQFTTVVGDNPERAIPSAGDLFRAGIRSLKFGTGGGGNSSISNSDKASSETVNVRANDSKGGKVGYAWINISQDVDWEGQDVGETIGSLMELALDYGIKPWVGAEYAVIHGMGPSKRGTPPLMAEQPSLLSTGKGTTRQGTELSHWEGTRIIPFEKTPDAFVCGGPLTSGGTVVVRIAT